MYQAKHDHDNDGDEDQSNMAVVPMDRERLMSDLMNTCVIAALIGGFALGNLSPPAEDEDPNSISNYIYILSYITVHACTCSALTSAFIYAAVNKMGDRYLCDWAKKQKLLLCLPMVKFVSGCMCYMVSVILTAWRDLRNNTLGRSFTTVVGAMSVCSVWMVFILIEHTKSMGNRGNKAQVKAILVQ